MAPPIAAHRLLIVQFRQIGDVLLSTPVLRALRQHYPRSYIAFLTEEAPARVLRHNPYVDEVIIRPRRATWSQEWRLLRRLRRRRFDLVLDLIGNLRSALITWLTGARHRVAFARLPRSLLYTILVEHRHEVQEYTVSKRLRLLEALGMQSADLSLDFPYTAEEQQTVERFCQEQAIAPHELLICIDPTHHVPTRRWPGEQFSRLADLCHERLGARVLLLWGPGEQESVRSIAAAAASAPALIPAWDLGTLAALLARADLLVGCDSAPQHIAISQNTPTLTVLGATNGINWLPPVARHGAVLAGLPCQPCNANQCGPPLNIACLRTLSAETVFNAVQACRPWVPNMPAPHGARGDRSHPA